MTFLPLIFSKDPNKKNIGVCKYKVILNYNHNPKTTSYTFSNLYFTDKESIVVDDIQRGKEVESDENHFLYEPKLDNTVVYYKNFFSKKLISREYAFNEAVIVDDILKQIDWKIFSEKKKIGRFICQKAVANVRGRKYIAWFTVEVPVNTGPWKLYGLPGLILEAQDESGEISFIFDSLQISTLFESNIEAPKPAKNQREITSDDFIKVRTENIEKFKRKLSARPGVTMHVNIDLNPKSIEIYKN